MNRYYNVRNNKGRFARGFKWYLDLTLFGIVLVIGLIIALNEFFPETVYAVREKTVKVEVDNLKSKIEQIKNEALDDLEKCESGGYKEEDGIIIFDSNNKASIGPYQWQKDSVIHYYKTLYGEVVTKKEAVIIALERDKARRLAGDVIFSTEKGYTNWLNCANKTGLKNTIEIIKKLEK